MNGNRPAPAYPLRIGVTGHRKLPDPPAVARAAEQLLAAIARSLRAADNAAGPAVEWIAVSPLAAGADRIIARAVLTLPNSRLEVISPFALDDYREDFKQAEDRAEFEELLRRDPQPMVLANPCARARPGDPPAEIARKKEILLDGYLDAGRRVAEGCEILVAVWDGRRPPHRASTGAIVRYAVRHGRMVLWIDSQRPAAPVRRIVELRDANGNGVWEATCVPMPTSAEGLVPGFPLSALRGLTRSTRPTDRRPR